MRKIALLLFLIVLTSCKTLENRVDLSEAGLKTAAKNFTSSVNPFEKKANEYKKIISEKKYDDAELFLKNNKDFFEKRYQKNPSLIEVEVKELSDYVFDKNFKEEVLDAKIKLSQIKSFNNIDAWKSQHATIQMAVNSLNKVKNSYVISLKPENYSDAQELAALIDQTIQRVINSKNELINRTKEIVFETDYPNKDYFGIGYEAGDYQRSADYQTFAEEKFAAIASPQLFREKANSQSQFIESSTKERLNAQFLKLIKQELQRDGKVTFDEVINLVKNTTLPFSSSSSNFDDLVKIGYVDLEDKSNQKNETFDISIKQDTSLKVNNLLIQIILYLNKIFFVLKFLLEII